VPWPPGLDDYHPRIRAAVRELIRLGAGGG
jgi:hypothetical protein